MSLQKRVRAGTTAAILLALVVSLSASTAAAQTRNSARRIPLLASAETAGDFIRLADLLPASVPVWLAERAPDVVLGRSPQPGSVRTFVQEQLQRVLAGNPEILAAVSIPVRVEVRRTARELNREEILAAILRSLQASRLSTAEPVEEGALVRFPHVAVHSENPGLQVTQLEEGPGGLLRFQLWTAGEPAVRPFWAEVRGRLTTGTRVDGNAPRPAAPARAGLSAHSGDSTSREHYSLAGASAGNPRLSAPLVEPGEPATIVVESNGLRILATGIALERGWKGQRIRVRSVSTGKVLMARVLGERILLALY
jgi:hypothetical protein